MTIHVDRGMTSESNLGKPNAQQNQPTNTGKPPPRLVQVAGLARINKSKRSDRAALGNRGHMSNVTSKSEQRALPRQTEAAQPRVKKRLPAGRNLAPERGCAPHLSHKLNGARTNTNPVYKATQQHMCLICKHVRTLRTSSQNPDCIGGYR